MLPNRFLLLSETKIKNFQYKFPHIKWLDNIETKISWQANYKKSSSITFNTKITNQTSKLFDAQTKNSHHLHSR